MRIGIDARLWNETGVGRYIRNLVEQLSLIDSKNEYFLYLMNIPKVSLPDNFHLRAANIRWHSLAEQLLFPKILLQDQLDLVHFPYFSFPYLYKKPYVLTIHDLILHHFPTGKASTLPKWLYQAKYMGYSFLLKYGSRNAKRIITVSKATKEEIQDHLRIPSDKISVIYEGVDQHISQSVASPIFVKQLPNSYFLYVGNAYPHKNLETLLHAFSYMEKRTNATLVFVGKNDFFYNRIRLLSKSLQLSDQILFFTHVSDIELSFLYQHATALILPSLMEGFGLPALEAMSLNCPVIVSDIPVFHELYQNSVFYFDPHNPMELSHLLNERLLHPHDTALLKRANTRAKRFLWEKTALETLHIYESSIRI